MEPSSDHERDEIERLRRAMYSRSLSEQLKDKPRRALEQGHSTVGDDWKRPEVGAPKVIAPPRGISAARTGVRIVFGLSILFFLAAGGYFFYYFTFGSGAAPASAANIDIAIVGPPQVSGGEPTELQVVVTNRNAVPLDLADLVITYPPGTRSASDLTTDLTTQRISLGSIEAGGRRQGTLKAVFAGDTGTQADVKAELEYRVTGSNAIFVADSDYATTIGSAPITVTVDGNTQTVSGQPVELTVTVASNANAPVRDVLLSVGLPFGFSSVTSNPAPTHGSVWELGDFAPGQRREITIRGTLTGQEGDERVFHFTAGTRNSPDSQTVDVPLSNTAFSLQISQQFLGLALSVNGVSGSTAVVTPGGRVNVYINWQNNLTTPITDAVIVARLSGLQFDGSTVQAINGFYRSTDSTVLWDKTTSNGDLANIPAGAKGVVSFSFEVPGNDVLQTMRDPYLTISVNAAGKRLSESGVPENLQSTISQRVGLASDLVLTAQGLYYANPFGSVGPLPPEAGTETTYGAVFTVTNTTNKINNAKLTAVLPPYVRWMGIYSPRSENISFSLNNSTFTWDVGDIDPGVGVNGTQARQAAVAIGFTPSTSQIGQEPVLLQDISLTGTDAATGQTITKHLTNVTSDLSRVSRSSEGVPVTPDPGFTSTNATVVR